MKKVKSFFTIKRVYAIVFLSLFAWACFAFITINELIDTQKDYAKLINISGKQRMLSQKTTLIVKRLQEEKTASLRQHLKELIVLMQTDHNYLLANLPSSKIKAVYYEKPLDLNAKVQGYLSLLKSYSKSEKKELIAQIQKESFLLLPLLNEAVNAFEQESNQTIQDLKDRELFILLGTLLTLLLEAMFIVRPSLIKIEKKQQELKALNESLNDRIDEAVRRVKQKDEIIIQQSKMSAMGNMLENISHQWRQPLSAITSAASGLQLRNELDVISKEELEQSLEEVVNASKYLSSTIEDFREFFKKDREKVEFSLEEAFEKSMLILSSKFLNQGIEVKTKIEEVKVKGYLNELIQVLINILNNAQDVLAHNALNDRLIEIEIKKDVTWAYVIIKDNAGGIKEQIISKIFEPYFTTKHQAKGTGLGLYMSYQIITEHFNGELSVNNCTLDVQDRSTKGACFTIKLPLNDKSTIKNNTQLN